MTEIFVAIIQTHVIRSIVLIGAISQPLLTSIYKQDC